MFKYTQAEINTIDQQCLAIYKASYEGLCSVHCAMMLLEGKYREKRNTKELESIGFDFIRCL